LTDQVLTSMTIEIAGDSFFRMDYLIEFLMTLEDAVNNKKDDREVCKYLSEDLEDAIAIEEYVMFRYFGADWREIYEKVSTAEIIAHAPAWIRGLVFRNSTNCTSVDVCEFDRLVVDKLSSTVEKRNYFISEAVVQEDKLLKPFLRGIVTRIFSTVEKSQAVILLLRFAASLESVTSCAMYKEMYLLLQSNKQTKSFLAFNIFLQVSQTTNAEADEIHCKFVWNKLEKYSKQHIANVIELFDSGHWEESSETIEEFEFSLKWILPEVVRRRYQGKSANAKKLILFAKLFNSSDASCLLLRSLASESVRFKTFESFQEIDEDFLESNKICQQVKESEPLWTWNGNNSCSVTNKATDQQLSLDFQSTDMIGGENKTTTDDVWWKIDINADGLVSFRNVRFPDKFLYLRKQAGMTHSGDNSFLWKLTRADDGEHVKIHSATAKDKRSKRKIEFKLFYGLAAHFT